MRPSAIPRNRVTTRNTNERPSEFTPNARGCHAAIYNLERRRDHMGAMGCHACGLFDRLKVGGPGSPLIRARFVVGIVAGVVTDSEQRIEPPQQARPRQKHPFPRSQRLAVRVRSRHASPYHPAESDPYRQIPGSRFRPH